MAVRLFVFRPVSPPAGERYAASRLGGDEFRLEVADTPARRARGLAGRGELGANDGMFFRFDIPARRTFWMKGMRMPIDIIWLRDGVVSGIVKRAAPPPPGAADADIPRFISPGPADAVIEILAGRAAELGLRVGQRVEVLLP